MSEQISSQLLKVHQIMIQRNHHSYDEMVWQILYVDQNHRQKNRDSWMHNQIPYQIKKEWSAGSSWRAIQIHKYDYSIGGK